MTRWGHIFNVIYDIGKKWALKLFNTLCVNINLQRLLWNDDGASLLQLTIAI